MKAASGAASAVRGPEKNAGAPAGNDGRTVTLAPVTTVRPMHGAPRGDRLARTDAMKQIPDPTTHAISAASQRTARHAVIVVRRGLIAARQVETRDGWTTGATANSIAGTSGAPAEGSAGLPARSGGLAIVATERAGGSTSAWTVDCPSSAHAPGQAGGTARSPTAS